MHYSLFEYDLHHYRLASCRQSSESVVCFFVGTSEALAVTRHQDRLCHVRKLRTKEVWKGIHRQQVVLLGRGHESLCLQSLCLLFLQLSCAPKRALPEDKDFMVPWQPWVA